MTVSAGTLQWDRSGPLGSTEHEGDGWDAAAAKAESDGVSNLTVSYETPGALQEAFARELFSGAVFVPLADRLPTRRLVSVTFHLSFSEARMTVEGEVVASLPSHIARAGAAPGVSIQLAEAPAELRRRFELASGIKLTEVDLRPRPTRAPSPASPPGRRCASRRRAATSPPRPATSATTACWCCCRASTSAWERR